MGRKKKLKDKPEEKGGRAAVDFEIVPNPIPGDALDPKRQHLTVKTK